MSTEKTRVGIIGTGNIAQAHLRKLVQADGVEIAAVCDIAIGVEHGVGAQLRGGRVELDWSIDDGRVRFTVWNDAVMADDVALRVFERSFSTRCFLMLAPRGCEFRLTSREIGRILMFSVSSSAFLCLCARSMKFV